MSKLRVAIIGAGIGGEHLRAYRALPELYDVAVICDLDEQRAARLLRHCDAEYSSSLEATVTRTDVDVIDVCLPPMLHKGALLSALANGKHVIAEKPLVPSLADLDEVAAAVEAADRSVIPIFQYRFGSGLGQLRDLIERGVTGAPFVATLETHWNRQAGYYSVPWRGTWASELGGALVGHAIHIHDLVVGVLGPIAAVQASVATRVNDIEVEDCAALILTMASGALVTSSVTLGSAADQSRLRFCFEGLTAESGLDPYNPGTRPWTFTARAPHDQAAVDEALAASPEHAEGFTRQFELAHAAFVGAGPAPVTLGDARSSIELITATYQAAATGRRIELPLPADHPGYGGWQPRIER